MRLRENLKKAVVLLLTAVLMLGGSASALADGKGKNHHKPVKQQEKQSKHKYKGKSKEELKREINRLFKDVDPNKFAWALQHILNLAAEGVFKGYQDGTFQPNRSIPRVEAITAAVRLMGLKELAESEAMMKMDLNFKDAAKLKKKYPWAVGYVAVALENDLFIESENSVQPEKATDRLWATMLLVKALKLEKEAQAKMNTKLTFKDAHQIPAGAVGYVAVAMEKGLITGYTDRTFRPNAAVTRAEMSALLDRTGEQMPDAGNQVINGKITSVNATSMTLKKNDGTEVTLAVSSNVFIFREGAKAAIKALLAGDEVTVRTQNNTVVFIEVTKAYKPPTADFIGIGKISSITRTSTGEIKTISLSNEVNGGTQVVIYDVAENVTLLPKGVELIPNMIVELKGTNGVVSSIEVKI